MTLEQRIADVIRTEGPMTGAEIHARFDEFESRKQSAGLLGSMKRRGLLTLDNTTRKFSLAEGVCIEVEPAEVVTPEPAAEAVENPLQRELECLEKENLRLRGVIKILERDSQDLFGMLSAMNQRLAGTAWILSVGADGIRFEKGHVALKPASTQDIEAILALTETGIQFISEEART